MTENIVKFEADVQRQHPRYKLPLKCLIAGKAYDVVDWSKAGVGVSTPGAHLPAGSIQDIRLIFPFEGSEFAMDMKAEVLYSARDRTGLQYVDAEPDQLRTLRYIQDAILTGELLSAGEILDLQRRPAEAKARSDGSAEAQTSGRRFSSVIANAVRFILVVLVSLALVSFVATSIYQRVAVFPASSAFVSTDLIPVYASTDGVVTNLASGPVSAGDPIATILSAGGQSITMVATCDCVIEDVRAALDTQVKSGTLLLSQRESGSTNFVVAMVERSHLMDLYKGAKADIELADGRTITGAPLLDLPTLTLAGADAPSPVRIDLGAAGATSQVGQPVNVRFYRTNPLDALGISRLLEPISSLFKASK